MTLDTVAPTPPHADATIADLLGVNPSTVTRMVDRLVAARMVDRQTNPASRRENVVTLTDSGADVVRRATERRRERNAQAHAAHRRDPLPGGLRTGTHRGGVAPGQPDPDDPVDLLRPIPVRIREHGYHLRRNRWSQR